MTKNKKWIVAVSVATMMAATSLVMAAAQTTQESPQGKRPAVSSQGDFVKKGGMRGHHGNHKALLEFLQIDAEALKAARQEGKTLAAIAQEKGISEQQLKDFMIKQMTQRIDEGVKNGRIPADKAEQMKANMDQRVTDMINGKHPMGGKMMMKHAPFKDSQLLELLNIDEDTLKSELKAGKSLVEIAKERGVSEQQLKEHMIKQMTQRIDEGVKNGRIPADKAEQIKENMQQRVSDMINGKGPMHERKHKIKG